MSAISGIGWTRLLFRVALLWIHSAFLRVGFAAGLCDCIIGGASVICVLVRMGDVSITLCSSSFTLCSDRGVAVDPGGVRIALFFLLE